MKIKELKINKIKSQLKGNHFLFRVFNMSKLKCKEKKSFASRIKKEKAFIVKRFNDNDITFERFKRAKRNY